MSRLKVASDPRMLWPHHFMVLWWLANEAAKNGGDATAADVFRAGFEFGRPDYQRWSPRKVSTILTALWRRGLVETSAATDAWLPGRPVRRYWVTERGWRVLAPGQTKA